MKTFFKIIAIVALFIIINMVSTFYFEMKYKIRKPQKYKVIFGGVGLETLILYAGTREIAEKIKEKYFFGYDTCDVYELSEDEIIQERKWQC